MAAMMLAWGLTIDEAGRDLAGSWASRHSGLVAGDGGRLLEDVAVAILEQVANLDRPDPPGGESRAARLAERFGECAFTAGTPLQAVEDALDEIRDGLFGLCRTALAKSREEAVPPEPDEVLELAIRVDRVVSDMRRRAADAHAAALAEELRSRYRTLRHEMRNSLGTIRTSLALMSDESLPEAARTHPRLRDMLGRNAHFLDALILDALSDDAAFGVMARIGVVARRDEACWGPVGRLRGDADVDAGAERSRSAAETPHDLGRGNHRQDPQPGLF